MVDMNNINLNLFRFFIATAESKSLVEAGEKLGYSHSTVSTNISTLEKQLGVKLFNRNPLELTDVGKDIYITVKSGFTDIDFAGVIANSKNNFEHGKISIGCPSHILEFYLMKIIAQVVKDYPNFKINLDTSYECEDLIVALKNKNDEKAANLNTKWYKNADEMADAFNSINPFFPKEEMRKMLYEHLRLTTDEVNRRLQGDYIGDINAFDKVQIEILKMSQFLVNGIVKQFQNLF